MAGGLLLVGIAAGGSPSTAIAATLGLGLMGAAGIGILALRRTRRHTQRLLQDLRVIADGRVEHRLALDLPGAYGEIASQINRIGQRLAQLQDGVVQQQGEQYQRLRREHDMLQQQNQQLRATAARAADEARAQSERLASMSHELRTPLTGILGYADLLRGSSLNEEQAAHLSTIEKSARALLAMINDLLDLSRIEAGRLRLNEEVFALVDLVEETCALLAPLAYDKGLELIRIVYHDVPRQLRGDPQRLRQILTNLLSNAIKFTGEGEVVLRVMREKEDAGRVKLRFAVADTGIGIEADQLQRLFQPFRQLAVGATAPGSGLGLWISRKLVELMGGELSCTSTPGSGSVFTAELPFKLIAQSESSPGFDPRLAQREVWVCEPSATARLALLHWLEFWGLKIRANADQTALTQALQHDHRPQLLLLGLSRADDRDEPATAALLQRAQRLDVPTLVLSPSIASPVHHALRAAGATASVPKSIGHRRLHDEILRLMTPQTTPQTLPLQGGKVLVADNNSVNRHYMSALCRRLGLQVGEAVDGVDALAQWQSLSPAFVLLDARMPRMSGPQCASLIREQESTGERARCRIIAVSAHLEPEERSGFLDAGADQVLIKPFDAATLLAALQPEAAHQPAAAKLTADPELLELLREELPLQLDAVQQAFAARDLQTTREAAHSLRGTAAFYHLASLRQTADALEDWLLKQESWPAGIGGRRELEAVTRAVHETLTSIAD